MAFQNPDRETIKQLLEEAETVAVVGLSPNPERTSHMVSKAMQMRGYRIIPVNPMAKGEQILGELCYGSLSEVPVEIDIVNVFRRSETVLPIAEEAVQVKAKVLWLQQDIVNEQAAEVAQAAGLQVIMDRCIKVEDSILQPNKDKE